MPIYSQKTIHSANLDLLRELNAPFTVDDYSTLNQKIDSLGYAMEGINATIPPGEYPKQQYIVIGNGGHSIANDGNSGTFSQTNYHRATDAVLFNMIPFLVREANNDLTDPAERAKYRFRTLQNIDGTDYFVYYMMKVDFTTSEPEKKIINIVNGVADQGTDYVPSNSSQNPDPVVVDPNNANLSDGRYLVAAINMEFTLDSEAINNIVDACNIIYGNDNRAIISEIGVVSAFDKSVTSSMANVNGGSLTYDEAIFAQIMHFISAEESLRLRPSRKVLKYALSTTLSYPQIGTP